jgi:hypothetical protein
MSLKTVRNIEQVLFGWGLGAVDPERSPFPPPHSSSYVDSLTRGSAPQCGGAAGGHLPWLFLSFLSLSNIRL